MQNEGGGGEKLYSDRGEWRSKSWVWKLTYAVSRPKPQGSSRSVILLIILFSVILKQLPKTFEIRKHFQSTDQSLFKTTYKNMIKINKTLIDMRTSMNPSNVWNQHTLSCIYQNLVQIRVYKPYHYSPHHKILYKPHVENSTQPHPLSSENLPTKPSWKVIFEKWSELTLSKKTKTFLENHFYQFKNSYMVSI